MNFIDKNISVLKPGNLTLELVLIVTVLGLLGWSWVDYTSDPKVTEPIGTFETVLFNIGEQDLGSGLNYNGDVYRGIVTMLTAIILTSMALGVVLAKFSNEYIMNTSVEHSVLFIMGLVAVAMITLDIVPEENTDANSENEKIRDHSYGITGLILVSIIGGILANKTRFSTEYEFFGTTFLTTLSCIVLGLVAYLYSLLVTENEKDDYDRNNDNLPRTLTTTEKNTLLAALVLIVIVVVISLIHMYMERKSTRRFFGKSSPKRASPKRASPKRASPKRASPKRSLSPMRKRGSSRT